MAFPITVGDNPTTETIPPNAWSLVIQNVNNARINKDFNSTQVVFFTYVKAGDPAPIGITGTKWNVDFRGVEFSDSTTLRDLYVYPVDKSADLRLEA